MKARGAKKRDLGDMEFLKTQALKISLKFI